MSQNIIINFNKSKQVIVLMLFLHLSSLLALYLTDINVGGKIILLLAIIVSCFYQLSKQAWRNSRFRLKKIEQINEKSWQLSWHNGKKISAELTKKRLFLAQLPVLSFNFLDKRGTFSLVCFTDMMSSEEWRKLQILVRLPIK